jgi:hypothetical protein
MDDHQPINSILRPGVNHRARADFGNSGMFNSAPDVPDVSTTNRQVSIYSNVSTANRRAGTESNDSTGDFQPVKPTTRPRASTESNYSMGSFLPTTRRTSSAESNDDFQPVKPTTRRRASTESNDSMVDFRRAANHQISNDSDVSMGDSRQTENRRMSNDSDVSMGAVKSKDQPSQLESIANARRDSLPIASYSNERPSQMSKETDEMRLALREKLRVQAAAQPMSTEEKRNKNELRKLKIRLLEPGPSGGAHRLSQLTQQPGTLFFQTYFFEC